MDKKDLMVKQSDQLSLARTDGLLAITNKLLARRDNQGLVESDGWLDELIAWADDNGVSDYCFNQHHQLWYGFPRDKKKILALTELYLIYEEIKILPESFGKLTGLTELNLEGNQLKSLPESFANLTNLKGLSLQKNKFITLPEFIGKLTNLYGLGLWENELIRLPDSIGNLTNLEILGLGENKLEELPETIGNLTSLSVLRSWKNKLTILPKSISKLSNLVELNFKYNQLTTLPDSIGNLTNLTKLCLSDNQLTGIPETISNLTNLNSLLLNSNQFLKLTTEQKQWLIDLKNNGCEVEIDNFEEITANNDIFNKLQELIDKAGIDYVTDIIANTISSILPSKELAYQFIFEEIEAASLGNDAAMKFARESGISPKEYNGAMRNSSSEIEDYQQTLLAFCLQLRNNTELMVEFRLKVDDKIMKNLKLGKYES